MRKVFLAVLLLSASSAVLVSSQTNFITSADRDDHPAIKGKLAIEEVAIISDDNPEIKMVYLNDATVPVVQSHSLCHAASVKRCSAGYKPEAIEMVRGPT